MGGKIKDKNMEKVKAYMKKRGIRISIINYTKLRPPLRRG